MDRRAKAAAMVSESVRPSRQPPPARRTRAGGKVRSWNDAGSEQEVALAHLEGETGADTTGALGRAAQRSGLALPGRCPPGEPTRQSQDARPRCYPADGMSERRPATGGSGTEARAIGHLEALRSDVRSEIKQRIEQRDRYSIQLTISLSVIVGLAFTTADLDRVLIAAPLVSIYFTVLILYSYKIHGVLAAYLRETLEPELASRCAVPQGIEWETFYARHAVPGIRKGFFVAALWSVLLLSMIYLFFASLLRGGDGFFLGVLGVVFVVYLIACILITGNSGADCARLA